jgi:hypothetical protein
MFSKEILDEIIQVLEQHARLLVRLDETLKQHETQIAELERAQIIPWAGDDR